MPTSPESEKLVLSIELKAGNRALKPRPTVVRLGLGIDAGDGRKVDGDHIPETLDVAELPGKLLTQQALDEGGLVEDVAEPVDDAGVAEGLERQRAGGPLRQPLLVGVDLVWLLDGIHVEVAVAGLGAGGASVSAAAKGADSEGEGGERGDPGGGDGGIVSEGLAMEGEEAGGG